MLVTFVLGKAMKGCSPGLPKGAESGEQRQRSWSGRAAPAPSPRRGRAGPRLSRPARHLPPKGREGKGEPAAHGNAGAGSGTSGRRELLPAACAARRRRAPLRPVRLLRPPLLRPLLPLFLPRTGGGSVAQGGTGAAEPSGLWDGASPGSTHSTENAPCVPKARAKAAFGTGRPGPSPCPGPGGSAAAPAGRDGPGWAGMGRRLPRPLGLLPNPSCEGLSLCVMGTSQHLNCAFLYSEPYPSSLHLFDRILGRYRSEVLTEFFLQSFLPGHRMSI